MIPRRSRLRMHLARILQHHLLRGLGEPVKPTCPDHAVNERSDAFFPRSEFEGASCGLPGCCDERLKENMVVWVPPEPRD